MSEGQIRYEAAEGIALVTIDRPAKRNALTSAMCADLHAAWQRFAASDDVRVAILTAAGDDVFTAGADLNDPPPHFWQAVPNVGVPVSKPIIAAVSGLVVGAGVTMVAMSDLCVAAENTRFIYPEAKVGVALGLVSSIATRIPQKLVMELLLIGDAVGAERAYQGGLVTIPRSAVEDMYHTQRAVNRVLQSEDAKEGPLAFREKRVPQFRGR
jgi:enoyl-CoA hydratase